MCGMRTSRSTRSGLVLPTSGSTCVPDWVSPTISNPPSASSARLIPSRTRRWSSAITTRTAVSVAQASDAASCRKPRRVARRPETEIGAGVEPVAGEGGVNEAVAETLCARRAGVVAALDRYFPLVWIGLYLLLPVSGWASEMFDSWFDQ